MFAKIIPLTKLPRKLQYFDYLIPKEFEEDIKIGHIVAIYFHGRKIYGVAESIGDNPDIPAEKIKPILSLTDIIIPKFFVDLIYWASEYYLVSPALLYKLFLPKPTRERGKADTYPKKELILTKNEVQNIILSLKNFDEKRNTFFLYDNNPKETLATVIKLAKKELEANKQALILVPAIEDINYLAPYLHSVFGEKLIIWKGKLSAGAKYSIWQKLRGNESAVILGTRPACFLPLPQMSLICILNCVSQDHKQWDMNPRYDARKIVQKLQDILRVKIVFSDILPDLNIYNEINSENIVSLNEPENTPDFSLVDIKQEKNSSTPLFSYPLYEMISGGLKNGGKNILFLNRREDDSFLICNDCHHIFSCPSCGRPMSISPVKNYKKQISNIKNPKLLDFAVSHEIDTNMLLCYHCGVEKTADLACPKCNGSRLKPLVFGTTSIKKFINKEFPEAKIEIAAKSKELWSENFDILITTDYFWKNILPKMDDEKIYGTALLDFDFYLARPEFNQGETALLALHKFFRFAQNHAAKKIIIQTACPENPIFSSFQDFYQKEAEERKALQYPPFAKLIKIICKNPDKMALDYEVKKLYNELIRLNFNVLPPFDPYTKKRAKNFLKHIILKEKNEKSLEELKKIIPDEYQIDIDPISIY